MEGGASRRSHLETGARRGNVQAIEALQGPEFPHQLALLWERFLLLDAQRSYGEHGPERIGFEAIDAANRLLSWGLAPEDVDALLDMDLAMLAPEGK